jgi:type IV pilus assembly protein PilX
MQTIVATLRYAPQTRRMRQNAISTHGIAQTENFGPAVIPNQRGAILITALMLLLIMTILGITAVTTSTLQEKMAGNMRDQYMAQEAGDAILRAAENWIFKQTSKPTPSCSPTSSERVWDPGCPDILAIETQSDGWWTSNGFDSPSALNASDMNVSQAPRYVDAYLQRVPLCLDCNPKIYRYYYRTNGWSVGFTSNAPGLLQSTFSRRSDEFQN